MILLDLGIYISTLVLCFYLLKGYVRLVVWEEYSTLDFRVQTFPYLLSVLLSVSTFALFTEGVFASFIGLSIFLIIIVAYTMRKSSSKRGEHK